MEKLNCIVHLELSKHNEIGVLPRKNSISIKHKNSQYACYPFYKRITKYGRI
ncbi:hypothetical protein [Tenacibaculum maritimum]|uniref:hypothetical protein n=1 Tax=Tenacibaculum maritimum TaxID=107401 RepID=UPI0038768AC5